MTEEKFRVKVIWMTFILSILVVLIHSYNLDLFEVRETDGALAAFTVGLQSFVSAAIPTVAVPGFFMVSAYLFYRNVSWNAIGGKMQRRVGSVLVPYIVWNALYYAGFSFAGMFPALWDVIGRERVPFTLAGLADAILHFTYNPVLWYLQQLILLIALAPLIYAALSKAWLGGIALLALLAVIAEGTIIPVLNLDALLYYSTGAYLAMHMSRTVERESAATPAGRMSEMLPVAAGLLLCVELYSGSVWSGSVLMTVLFGLLSPMVIWRALPSALPPVRSCMRFSLFLYSLHFLLVRGINKALAFALAHNGEAALLVYLFMPAAVVALTWAAATFLKKKIPPLWRLLSGGR